MGAGKARQRTRNSRRNGSNETYHPSTHKERAGEHPRPFALPIQKRLCPGR